MSTHQVQPDAVGSVASSGLPFLPDELPLTVRQAAVYLGVSMQTVYLWLERKQIPHLRVMGRNIRFLRSDLEPFRATFKCEEMARPRKHDGVVYRRADTKILWMSYRDRRGKRIRESTFTQDWREDNKYPRLARSQQEIA